MTTLLETTAKKENLLDIGDVICSNGVGNWELKVVRFGYSKFYQELEITFIEQDGTEVCYLESSIMNSIRKGMYDVNPSWMWNEFNE